MLASLSLFVIASCGNESDGVFDREGFPFTFEYPDGFEETDDVEIDESLGAEPDDVAAVGTDDESLILVERFTLNVAIEEDNLDLAKSEIDGLIKQVDPSASSRKTQIAGLPALEIDEFEVPSVENGMSRLAILFDGDQEYFVNCQSTPDQRAAIDEACRLALETLALK